jgi:hypothetical protein
LVSNARRSIISIPCQLSPLSYIGFFVVSSDAGLSAAGWTKLVALAL